MHAFSYTWSLLVTWQRWQSHHLICHSQKPHAKANFMALCFMKSELLPIGASHCGNMDFQPFYFCDLDLDSITFIDQPDSYSLEIYWMCQNERPTSRLSKVIISQTYIQRDRQDRNRHSAAPLDINKLILSCGDFAYLWHEPCQHNCKGIYSSDPKQ